MAAALALIFTFAGMLSTKQRNGYDTGEKDIASRREARLVFVLLVIVLTIIIWLNAGAS
jgi:hypothetical protein